MESNIEGFWNVTPKIRKISFPVVDKIKVTLEDGRTIIAPLSFFPGIQKLTMPQRQKWFIFGNGFSFDECDQVYHIEQILGNFRNYQHELPKD
jgi:hypothetical protein